MTNDDPIRSNGLVLTRVFEAPVELVFRVWTDPEHFKNWWGPKGFFLSVIKMEVRPGGLFLGSQRSPEGQVMWGKFAYQEVTAPEKLVFIQSFSDEEGNTIRAPFDPNWPLQILNTLTFSAQGDNTLLTLRAYPLDASEEERAVFEAMRGMIQQGFGGTFDQLADYLEDHGTRLG